MTEERKKEYAISYLFNVTLTVVFLLACGGAIDHQSWGFASACGLIALWAFASHCWNSRAYRKEKEAEKGQ